jgi:hypothetical protein
LIANLLKNPHITGLNIDLLTEKVEIGNYWPVISSNFAHLLMNIFANNLNLIPGIKERGTL